MELESLNTTDRLAVCRSGRDAGSPGAEQAPGQGWGSWGFQRALREVSGGWGGWNGTSLSFQKVRLEVPAQPMLQNGLSRCSQAPGTQRWGTRPGHWLMALAWGSMKRGSRLVATKSCMALVTLSPRKQRRTSSFWNWSRYSFQMPGKGSL